jgi:hypothetical protein
MVEDAWSSKGVAAMARENRGKGRETGGEDVFGKR